MRRNDAYSPFSEADIREGMEVEREHTSDPEEQRRIALDHLREDSRYYLKLRHIEKGSIWGWDALFRP